MINILKINCSLNVQQSQSTVLADIARVTLVSHVDEKNQVIREKYNVSA